MKQQIDDARTVMLFRNGAVAVFDSKGQQMPRFQGSYEHVRKWLGKLHSDCRIEDYR